MGNFDSPALTRVNTMLGNVKRPLAGTRHSLDGKHLPLYLAEFCHPIDRRFDRWPLGTRLVYVAVRTPPLPYRLLALAEA